MICNTEEMIVKTIAVSPSSFGFLHDECKACFYMDAHRIAKRPRAPFPAIFNTIDLAMKRHYSTSSEHRISGLAEPFMVESSGRWVRSAPLAASDGGLPLVIRGIYDSLLVLDDGSRVVCDFKTSPVGPDLVNKYARQLHAYAWALEQPECGRAVDVDRLGLAVFAPSIFQASCSSEARLGGTFTWVDIARDDQSFGAFLNDVSILLSSPEPPLSSAACSFCAYREVA